jgi:hypothetical protein
MRASILTTVQLLRVQLTGKPARNVFSIWMSAMILDFRILRLGKRTSKLFSTYMKFMTNDDCVRIFDNILGLRPISALNHCKESKATTLCGLKCVSHYLPLLPYLQRPPAYRNNVIFKSGMLMGSGISMH